MAKKNNQENPFDRGQAPKFPDMACIGVVTGIGEPKQTDYDKELNLITFPVEITTGGAVPVRAKGDIKLTAAFLDQAFRRDDLPTVENGDKLDKVYENHIASRARSKSVPTLLGFSGMDYEKYGNVGRALQGCYRAWIAADPTGKDEEAMRAFVQSLHSTLAEHLVGTEIGFWLVQGQKPSGNMDPETGREIWERTQFFNIKAPRFVDAAFFRPDKAGRDYVLKSIGKQKGVDATTGKPYREATFDETTEIPAAY